MGGGAGAVPGAVVGAELGASVCGVASTAVDVVEGAQAGLELWDNKDKIQQQFSRLSEETKKYNEIVDAITEPDEQEKKKKLQKLQDEMQTAVNEDPCLQAKRCVLTPHTRKETKDKVNEKGKSSPIDSVFGLNNPGGCCPGQTGHHLVYEKMVGFGKNCTGKANRKIGSKKTNEGYVGGAAPTVCVEGVNQKTGTHGEVHDKTDKLVQKMMNGEYNGYESCGSSFTMDCAIEAAAEAHAKQFPSAGCDKQCIKQQLENYYGPLNCNPDAVNKQGKPITPTDGNGGGGF